MGLKSFSEWLSVREDSAFGRSRKAAAQGLGPTIPDAAINSRNTAPAWQKDAIVKRNKKKKRKKKVGSPRPEPMVHHDLDNWLQSVDNLKKDLERLRGKLFSPDADDNKVVTKPAKPEDTKSKKDGNKKIPEKQDDELQEKPDKKQPFKKSGKEKPFDRPLKKDFKEPEE